jgi:hypothetical protein
MLYTETVEAKTLDLIRKLMADSELKGFNLVGGTALSLQIGHRISEDIDLFSQKEFDAAALKSYLEKEYGSIIKIAEGNTIRAEIGEVKLDILAHQYPMVKPAVEVEGIRFTSLEDIGAMKINAIVRDGTRVKDFIDMYSLLEYKSLKQLVSAYVSKYHPDVSENMAFQSLKYFQDVDLSATAINLLKDFEWTKVKERLENAVKESEKIFVSQDQSVKHSLEQKLETIQKQDRTLAHKKSMKPKGDES